MEHIYYYSFTYLSNVNVADEPEESGACRG